jgi:hypothetical protein
MKFMIARFPGKCAACAGPINRGDNIAFFGKGHAEHATCAQKPKERQIAGPCWICNDPAGYFRNHGAATPVWCDACNKAESDDIARGSLANEDEAAGFERGTLASDRRLARQGLTVIRTSGGTWTQNSRGRCEDAPCCGCCT